MNVLQAIVLGIVEGVTEFLPISSTFHLIFSAKILQVPQTEFVKFFEVFIQSGAILSVLLLYWKELVANKDLAKKVLTSFLPTAIIGFLLYKIIKGYFFEADMLMIGVFAAVGIVFITYEYFVKKDTLKKTLSALTYKEALLIGVVQALAVVPGVSRAGAVLLGMMFLKYRREESAKYSFMLSIPTIFAASAYDFAKMRNEIVGYTGNIIILLVGFAAAFVTSYFVVRWLIGYLKTNTLTPFGYYRIILAIIIFLFVLR